VGLREDSVEIPDGGRLEAVFELYAGRFPRLRDMSKSLVLALNQRFSEPSAPLSEGHEVAFLPPVRGVSTVFSQVIEDPAGHLFAITRDPIDSLGLAHRLQRAEDGAVVTFEGIARNNTKGRPTRYLEYECYEAMAIKMMAQIGCEIAHGFQVGRVGIIHRLGRIEIGEASVVVVAAAPHRKPAFEAALEGINRLKKLVPIWKKEYFADGEVWVDGEWDDSVTKARS
jgi:molybdopterin synthase catalytic subunit/molybdopterin converting factor small subunit